jgi:hypothetical protein
MAHQLRKGEAVTDEIKVRWPGFKYEQVPGLANRLISRYLRTQRKNMRRFFEERGLYTLLDRMNQIRKSRQGMLAKNRIFQDVLNEYSKLVNPSVTNSDPTTPAGVPNVVVQPETPVIAGETEAAHP